MIYVSIILATLAIQVPNIWAINYFAQAPGWVSALWISLACLPASFVSTACHAYYYGKGYTELSYPALAVMAYGISFMSALMIHGLILKSKTLQVGEIVGGSMIFIGLLVAIYFKKG